MKTWKGGYNTQYFEYFGIFRLFSEPHPQCLVAWKKPKNTWFNLGHRFFKFRQPIVPNKMDEIF